MYQSIPRLTTPLGQTFVQFFETGEFLPPGHKVKCKTPTPGAGKISAKNPPPGQLFKKNNNKKPTKHETEVMKNSTEMLMCLEILKQ